MPTMPRKLRLEGGKAHGDHADRDDGGIRSQRRLRRGLQEAVGRPQGGAVELPIRGASRRLDKVKGIPGKVRRVGPAHRLQLLRRGGLGGPSGLRRLREGRRPQKR
ncbi:unnamed protein product [Phytomonas sp. Hart1]|nr:unnamed protein product [Phytomonas sp. Hart1]|eukprot:CCW66159.1 unnamed protein product [Phytomonas sp. isolate Hart1]